VESIQAKPVLSASNPDSPRRSWTVLAEHDQREGRAAPDQLEIDSSGDESSRLFPVVRRQRHHPADALERTDLTVDQPDRVGVEGTRIELLRDDARQIRLEDERKESPFEEAGWVS
jgi:hypothetical protein